MCNSKENDNYSPIVEISSKLPEGFALKPNVNPDINITQINNETQIKPSEKEEFKEE